MIYELLQTEQVFKETEVGEVHPERPGYMDIETLEKKLSDLEASKKKLEKSYAAVRASNEEFKEDIRRLTREQKALNAVNESLRKEQSTLKKENEDLRRKLKDETTKLEKQKEAMQETYQKEVLEQINKLNKKHEKVIMKLEFEHKLELDRLKLKVIKDFAGGNK